MKRRSPSSIGLVQGAAESAIGRASRAELGGGREGELWRLPGGDEAIGDRLTSLGASGIGGFFEGGADDEGVWLARRPTAPTLADRMKERRGPWPWRDAVRVALDVARALAAAEKKSLFSGPLLPDAVAMASDGSVFLIAAALVGAMVGAPDTGASRGTSSISPLWTPPEQADGAVWDSAANRYALGLILYRVLSGEHAFGGAGLRHALGEASHREAAPFVETVAIALPSGLQSLALRLLDPHKERRPAKAEAIVTDLERFFATREEGVTKVSAGNEPKAEQKAERKEERKAERREERKSVPEAKGEAARSKASERAPRAEREEREARPATLPARRSRASDKPRSMGMKLLPLWPLAAGVAIAAFAFSKLAPAPAAPKLASVAPEQALSSQDTNVQDCADCHTRQAAEWRRSVMAHSVKSPLFNGLESLIEEQVGRDFDCPNGAGILRRANVSTACRDRESGVAVTGSGGEHWCVNCHSPSDNLETAMPAWDGRAGGDPRSRRPVRDLINDRAIEGISCGFCHQVHGPVGGRGSRGYQGNPTWISFETGAIFASRPEDGRGLFGIANSGYDLRPEELILPRGSRPGSKGGGAAGGLDPVVHATPSKSSTAYLRSSEFCGACHDVRLFGTDSFGAQKGEHFKRLRNAYSEWAAWAKDEERKGRTPASCQDCHMSTYPGVCEPDGSKIPEGDSKRREGVDPECPPGTRFSARAPGSWPSARVATASHDTRDVVTHYFSGVDVPLAREFAEALVDEESVDLAGIPTGARRRRDMLLRHTFRFDMGQTAQRGGRIEIPIEVENIGAGHRVPAGFSQEREFWVHLTVRDGNGRVLYEVGRVDRGDEDLRDKVFLRVNTNPSIVDRQGRPEGLFGADVRDGPDVPQWSPPPSLGGSNFRGKGLINFQNGFLRCVRCIGFIGPSGDCEAAPGQGLTRADRFADGDYDIDTGECRSNLTGERAFLETYYPVGALDASRGQVKGPDAIIDTRSMPPNVPIRYTYELATEGRRGPFRAEARLLFRAFPPYLVRAFADYEREQASRGLRPSGPLVTQDMLRRLEIVELARVSAEVR